MVFGKVYFGYLDVVKLLEQVFDVLIVVYVKNYGFKFFWCGFIYGLVEDVMYDSVYVFVFLKLFFQIQGLYFVCVMLQGG